MADTTDRVPNYNDFALIHLDDAGVYLSREHKEQLERIEFKLDTILGLVGVRDAGDLCRLKGSDLHGR